jgi:peptidyl-dipeptidase A
MWGQSWSNILDVTIPYPGKNFLDVTTEMVEQVSYTRCHVDGCEISVKNSLDMSS